MKYVDTEIKEAVESAVFHLRKKGMKTTVSSVKKVLGQEYGYNTVSQYLKLIKADELRRGTTKSLLLLSAKNK